MITEVGSGTQRATGTGANVDSGTVAYPANVVSGNLLITAGSCFKSPASTSVTVTDTRGTSYTVKIGTAIGGYVPFIAYGLAPSSGACTVTVNPEGPQNWFTASIDEFASDDGWPDPPLSVDLQEATSTDAAPTVNITTLEASELIIGVHTTAGNVTRLPGTNYTQIGEHDGNTIAGHNAEFRIVTPTLYAVDWSVSASTLWRAIALSLKPVVILAEEFGALVLRREFK